MQKDNKVDKEHLNIQHTYVWTIFDADFLQSTWTAKTLQLFSFFLLGFHCYGMGEKINKIHCIGSCMKNKAFIQFIKS